MVPVRATRRKPARPAPHWRPEDEQASDRDNGHPPFALRPASPAGRTFPIRSTTRFDWLGFDWFGMDRPQAFRKQEPGLTSPPGSLTPYHDQPASIAECYPIDSCLRPPPLGWCLI